MSIKIWQPFIHNFPFSLTSLDLCRLGHYCTFWYPLHKKIPSSHLTVNHTASTMMVVVGKVIGKYCKNCVWLFGATSFLTTLSYLLMWCVMMPQNPAGMFYKWLEFCKWAITRFTRGSTILVVYLVKSCQD